MTSRRRLQAVLATMGAVATCAGARGVVTGAAEFGKAASVPAGVDSEYRFYAAWYHVFGVLLLRAARRPEGAGPLVRACGAGLWLAASGRLLSLRRVGSPQPLQKALLALELAVPVVVVPWQAKVAKEARGA